MTTREPMLDGDLTAEKSWRSFVHIILVVVGYIVLRWLVLLFFPGVPCSPIAPSGCTPEPTTSQLFVSALLPFVAAGLVLVQLPILWQQTKTFAAIVRWGTRLIGLGIWIWLVASAVSAVGAIATRFTS